MRKSKKIPKRIKRRKAAPPNPDLFYRIGSDEFLLDKARKSLRHVYDMLDELKQRDIKTIVKGDRIDCAALDKPQPEPPMSRYKPLKLTKEPRNVS